MVHDAVDVLEIVLVILETLLCAGTQPHRVLPYKLASGQAFGRCLVWGL